ncbi:hypothetical protein AHAS_Ahas04G0136100 [Arachis hypogaea]
MFKSNESIDYEPSIEWAKDKIRVNAVAPGLVKTLNLDDYSFQSSSKATIPTSQPQPTSAQNCCHRTEGSPTGGRKLPSRIEAVVSGIVGWSSELRSFLVGIICSSDRQKLLCQCRWASVLSL